MRVNKTKAKIAAGQCAIGVSVAFPSPDLVELCAAVGFDFVTFDTEHEPMNSEQIVHCIRAAESFDITPIVRLPRNPDLVLRFLNAGAQGIHVPRCTTAADMKEVVQWTRFHPLGERTFYNRGRSGNYNVGTTDTRRLAWPGRTGSAGDHEQRQSGQPPPPGTRCRRYHGRPMSAISIAGYSPISSCRGEPRACSMITRLRSAVCNCSLRTSL